MTDTSISPVTPGGVTPGETISLPISHAVTPTGVAAAPSTLQSAAPAEAPEKTAESSIYATVYNAIADCFNSTWDWVCSFFTQGEKFFTDSAGARATFTSTDPIAEAQKIKVEDVVRKQITKAADQVSGEGAEISLKTAFLYQSSTEPVPAEATTGSKEHITSFKEFADSAVTAVKRFLAKHTSEGKLHAGEMKVVTTMTSTVKEDVKEVLRGITLGIKEDGTVSIKYKTSAISHFTKGS